MIKNTVTLLLVAESLLSVGAGCGLMKDTANRTGYDNNYPSSVPTDSITNLTDQTGY